MAHIIFLIVAFVNITLIEIYNVVQTLPPCTLGFFVVGHWTMIRFEHKYCNVHLFFCCQAAIYKPPLGGNGISDVVLSRVIMLPVCY